MKGKAKALQGELFTDATEGPASEVKSKKQQNASNVMMMNARNQAEAYARALPVDHGWPPFILVCDVGRVLEVR